MRTIPFTPEQMDKRLLRFSNLIPQKLAYESEQGIPAEAFEMIAAKTIYLLMAPEGGAGSVTRNPGITGEAGMSLNIVECPPGNGPMLHAHEHTEEIFFCLSGEFEVCWGDAGEHTTVLSPLDMIAVPRSVGRAFKNISDVEARMLVIIRGEEALGDIAYSPKVGEQITERFGANVRHAFEDSGINFTMGTQ